MGRTRRLRAATDAQPFELAPPAREGLQILLYANDSAVDCGASAADFAVGIEELVQTGMDKCDLRWLIQKGYVEHFVEFVAPLRVDVDLLPSASLRLSRASCFCLTAAGVQFAHQYPSRHPVIIGKTTSLAASRSPSDKPIGPVWDPTRRTLSFHGTVIRRFTKRNSKQVQIVIAFHEQRFAASIDDPLQPSNDVDPKDRLYKAVLRLSKSICPPLIRFECDSDHTAVSWHEVAPPRENKYEVIAKRRLADLSARFGRRWFLLIPHTREIV